MIIIKQNSHDISGLNNIVQKNNSTEIKLNTSLIEDDIYRLSKMHPNNDSDKKNIEGIIKYLKKLKSKINSDEEYSMIWALDNWKIKAYPIPIVNYPNYGIKASDYIEVGKNKVIRLNYIEVFQLIAFEMMYRELGYSTEDIEKKLKDVGISVISGAEIVKEFIDEDAINFSQVCKISSSPYASEDGSLAWDYFFTAMDESRAFEKKRYKEPVERSIDVAIDIIAKQIMDNFILNKVKFQICSMSADGLYFLIDDIDNDKIYEIAEPVIVRIFGRKFEVKPKIEIF